MDATEQLTAAEEEWGKLKKLLESPIYQSNLSHQAHKDIANVRYNGRLKLETARVKQAAYVDKLAGMEAMPEPEETPDPEEQMAANYLNEVIQWQKEQDDRLTEWEGIYRRAEEEAASEDGELGEETGVKRRRVYSPELQTTIERMQEQAKKDQNALVQMLGWLDHMPSELDNIISQKLEQIQESSVGEDGEIVKTLGTVEKKFRDVEEKGSKLQNELDAWRENIDNARALQDEELIQKMEELRSDIARVRSA
jgi:DNA anti-recombination protein RmuC